MAVVVRSKLERAVRLELEKCRRFQIGGCQVDHSLLFQEGFSGGTGSAGMPPEHRLEASKRQVGLGGAQPDSPRSFPALKSQILGGLGDSVTLALLPDR